VDLAILSARHAGAILFTPATALSFCHALSFVPTQRMTEYAGSKYGGFRLEPMWFFGS